MRKHETCVISALILLLSNTGANVFLCIDSFYRLSLSKGLRSTMNRSAKYSYMIIWLLLLRCSSVRSLLINNNDIRPLLLTARRHVLRDLLLWIPIVAVAYEPDVTLVVERPGDQIGLELIHVQLGKRSAVAIQRVIKSSNNNNKRLLPGMILNEYESAVQVQERLRNGPYPVQLVFTNLAAGGDAISDGGTPMVTAQDALQLARQTAFTTTTTNNNAVAYETTILKKESEDCAIKSRRGDVLEIIYQARWQSADGPVYDSSEQRGTGRPYQMVLGSGDMLPGVDLGLYGMCPGEVRALQIPPVLAYGARGNPLYRVPPDTPLYWKVKLVTVNSVGVGDTRSREEMEERVAY